MNQPKRPNPMMQITSRPDQLFVRGRGAYLFDAEDRAYLDWIQGWAVNCLGHSPAVLVEALHHQAVELINPSPAFYNRPALDLAAWLVAHSCFDQVFFANSGAEANEGAIKLARKWGQIHKDGAFGIITFTNSFHGRTLATMAATGKPGWNTLFAPPVPGFNKAEYNNLESVRQAIDTDTVAVMLEPIQGEAGVIPATQAFMEGLRALCDEAGLLLIVDEVQTGCARTGDLFAYQGYGITPDIMTLGKGIGGGVPLSALLARESVCCFAYGDQGGTYCGNPLMCAAGLAVMQTIGTPEFLTRVRENGSYLDAGLQKLVERFSLAGTRGTGMLRALLLDRPVATDLVVRARESGFLINAPRPDILRFMPALNTGRDEIDDALGRLTTLLEEV